MSGIWRRVTLTRLQLGLIAGLSAAATAVVIVAGLGGTPAQSAALAALRTRPYQVRVTPAAPVPGPTPTTVPTDSPAAAAPPPATPMASAPAVTTSTAPAPAVSTPAATTTTTTPAATTPAKPGLRIKHVFVIALTTTSYDAAFGSGSVARYLNRKLVPRGTLLGGYETLGGAELPDYLAMLSGQPPNPDTSSECPTYAEFPAGTAPGTNGELAEAGCVYPNTVLTIGDQVTAAGHQWRAYVDDLGSTTCAHPNSGAPLSAPAGTGPDYSLLHNPFIYFHSLLDLGGCTSNDVSLDQLPRDLAHPRRTPTYAFIAPGACLDAAASACPTGAPAGLAGEDAFLHQWVPRILHSAAYKRGGAVIITFSLPDAAASQSAPAASAPTGALLLSPYAARGKIVSTAFNPYSVLKTVEKLLGYGPLAAARSARSFATDLVPGS